MSAKDRRKGRAGELEVRKLLEGLGFAVRKLSHTGDLIAERDGFTFTVESKRTERARPFEWWAQATADRLPGSEPLVIFRRSGERWLVIGDAERLLGELVRGR